MIVPRKRRIGPGGGEESCGRVESSSGRSRSTLGDVTSALPATGSVSATVSTSADVLWPVVSDPAVWVEFSSELKEAHYLDDAGPRVGAVIEGRNERGEFSWTTESVVTRCEPPTVLEWATGDRTSPTATWTFDIVPAGETVTLTHSVVLHADVAPLGPAVAKDPENAHEIVQRRLNHILANMQSNVDGIAARVSAPPPS